MCREWLRLSEEIIQEWHSENNLLGGDLRNGIQRIYYNIHFDSSSGCHSDSVIRLLHLWRIWFDGRNL